MENSNTIPTAESEEENVNESEENFDFYDTIEKSITDLICEFKTTCEKKTETS
ncbi:hypothetical protein [Alphaentomopoxvirus acuprea]|uniref:Uncharacterized protein n=1 Tax=Alphaentomopoxvirus acuprea TaxID=62099 RepID=W6JIK8_9POXV|nr:hypothetical protein BA82_gp043 [Anomala cuprea entomopoxvirus]BAO49403.1 hypothetical protein [Anomala cuprea entomopoxvirus]